MVDRGILLSYIKYGDNDAILHCFTENAGFQSFFMRGIYSPKNKKKAYLTPMTELYFTISDFHKKYNIQTISKIEKVKTLENYEYKGFAASVREPKLSGSLCFFGRIS